MMEATVKNPMLGGLSAVLAALCTAMPAFAIELEQTSPHMAGSAPEFSQAAADLEKGQMFMTKGLVCDQPSEIDAVITLARKGEALEGALQQINTGIETPRCVVGKMLIAQYVEQARTFLVNQQMFHVHQVRVIGVALPTPSGVVPMKLKEPMEQYVVSADDSKTA